MCLEATAITRGQDVVEMVGDRGAGVPAGQRYAPAGRAPLRAVGQRRDQHHPTAPEPLLGRVEAHSLDAHARTRGPRQRCTTGRATDPRPATRRPPSAPPAIGASGRRRDCAGSGAATSRATSRRGTNHGAPERAPTSPAPGPRPAWGRGRCCAHTQETGGLEDQPGFVEPVGHRATPYSAARGPEVVQRAAGHVRIPSRG